MSIRPVFACMMPLFLLLTLLFAPAVSVSQEQLSKTPADQEGPFYPVVRQQDEDYDLIHVYGQRKQARGKILHLSGEVVGTQGNPVKNAGIEIWQTDPNGLYKDERDLSPGDRDPNFQYWGKEITGTDGTFSFITLIPGEYEPRPAHIHFKVWLDDRVILTSQIYFANHPDEKRKGSKYSTNPLQTVELQETESGEYKAFFRIVL